jgi:hypothetical protein
MRRYENGQLTGQRWTTLSGLLAIT